MGTPDELRRSDFKNEWEVAASEGIVGVAVATGDKLSEMHKETIDNAKKIKTSSSLIWRSDGDEVLYEDAERAHDEGFTDLPGGLTQ